MLSVILSLALVLALLKILQLSIKLSTQSKILGVFEELIGKSVDPLMKTQEALRSAINQLKRHDADAAKTIALACKTPLDCINALIILGLTAQCAQSLDSDHNKTRLRKEIEWVRKQNQDPERNPLAN